MNPYCNTEIILFKLYFNCHSDQFHDGFTLSPGFVITVLKSFDRLSIRLHMLEIRIRNKDKVQGEERDDFSRAGDYFFVLVLSPCPDRKIFFSPSRLASGDDGCFYPSP